MPVMAVGTPVMALEDVLVTMLYALDEHALDYSQLLLIARALREQVDWPQLRVRAAGSPYAKAFLTKVEELGIAPAASRPPERHGATTDAGGGAHSRVRAVSAVVHPSLSAAAAGV
jgi:hypothetical protein